MAPVGKPQPAKDYLTVPEAARLLGLDRRTLLLWLKSDRPPIPAINLARPGCRAIYRILRADLDAYKASVTRQTLSPSGASDGGHAQS